MMDDERRTLNDERRRTARAAAVIRPLVIVDYGVGNLRNVHKALEAVGAAVQVVTSAEGLANAAGIVLPGVGAFGDAAANLRSAGFEAPLLRAVVAGTPLLGICVGMQLLFDESEEMGRYRGLGILPGRVVRFPGDLVPQPPPEGDWGRRSHQGRDYDRARSRRSAGTSSITAKAILCWPEYPRARTHISFIRTTARRPIHLISSPQRTMASSMPR